MTQSMIVFNRDNEMFVDMKDNHFFVMMAGPSYPAKCFRGFQPYNSLTSAQLDLLSFAHKRQLPVAWCKPTAKFLALAAKQCLSEEP